METIELTHDGVVLKGQLARPAGGGAAVPVVLVFPSAIGLGDHALAAVERLAAAGWLALGVDLYGEGLYSGYDNAEPECGAQFQRFLDTPGAVRARAGAWLDRAAALPGADPARIAAIGYCFGGYCVLELARAGAELKAAISYHGLLTTALPAEPGAIRGEVAAYCGAADPYAPAEAIESLRRELGEAGARHQITVFSGAEHGFTDPEAGKMGRPGIAYDALADRVSWAGTLALLETVFG
jgi:dienelactone hydrolase